MANVTLATLRIQAKENKIKGRSKMNKQQLMEALGLSNKATTMNAIPLDILKLISNKAEIKNAAALASVNKMINKATKEDVNSRSLNFERYRSLISKVSSLILKALKPSGYIRKRIYFTVTKKTENKETRIAELILNDVEKGYHNHFKYRAKYEIPQGVEFYIGDRVKEKFELQSLVHEGNKVRFGLNDFKNYTISDWLTAHQVVKAVVAEKDIWDINHDIRRINFEWMKTHLPWMKERIASKPEDYKVTQVGSEFHLYDRYENYDGIVKHSAIYVIVIILLFIYAQHDKSINIKIRLKTWKFEGEYQITDGPTILPDLKLKIMTEVEKSQS